MSLASLVTAAGARLAATPASDKVPAPHGGPAVDQDADIFADVDDAIGSAPALARWVAVAFAIVAVGAVGGYYLNVWLAPADFHPSSAYVPLAGLFVLALALERFLEPFAGLVLPSVDRVKKTRDRLVASAVNASSLPPVLAGEPGGAGGDHAHGSGDGEPGPVIAVHVTASGSDVAIGLPATTTNGGPHTTTGQPPGAPVRTPERVAAADPVVQRLAKAAEAQKVIDSGRASRAVVLWGISAGLAMCVCGMLGVFLVRSLGTATRHLPNRPLDLIITGLVVGAGTKPLHDLVASIQSSTNSKADPRETDPVRH